MITSIAGRIVEAGIGSGRVSNEEKDVYLYGYTVLIETLTCMLCSFAIAIVFNEVMAFLLFLGCFMLLRIFGGGYHADTTKNCITLSALMIVGFCILISEEIVIAQNLILIIAASIGTVITFLNAPQIRCGDESIGKRCKSAIRKIYLLTLLITCILYFCGFYKYSCCIVLAQLAWLISLTISLFGKKEKANKRISGI